MKLSVRAPESLHSLPGRVALAAILVAAPLPAAAESAGQGVIVPRASQKAPVQPNPIQERLVMPPNSFLALPMNFVADQAKNGSTAATRGLGGQFLGRAWSEALSGAVPDSLEEFAGLSADQNGFEMRPKVPGLFTDLQIRFNYKDQRPDIRGQIAGVAGEFRIRDRGIRYEIPQTGGTFSVGTQAAGVTASYRIKF